MTPRLDVLFDVNQDSPYYRPTLDAVAHASASMGIHLEVQVVRTDTIDDRYVERLDHAVLIGPGTPYRSPASAELVIATARARGLPLVGT